MKSVEEQVMREWQQAFLVESIRKAIVFSQLWSFFSKKNSFLGFGVWHPLLPLHSSSTCRRILPFAPASSTFVAVAYQGSEQMFWNIFGGLRHISHA
ncbi:hypothetical protein K1719_046187 [Acacia pycnantha]|nr:hypothetical protein K1719_046187 [Acacia pycnantha]